MKKIFLLIIIFIGCKESKDKLDLITIKEYSILIEIPVGTNEKWEFNKINNKIERDSLNNLPRTINYLNYPFNYGMILNTNNSGDNDPLDAIVIGNRFEIGDTIQAKPIAIINTLDKEKSDPKILFIHSSSPLNQISSKKELKEKYPGVLKIIKIWLNNYKKESEVIDIKGKKNAIKLIKKSTIK
tara:strand:+ start:10753 stop:11307 length:555 start_codon:yes stop_codon:yes gene_type:complete